MICRMDPDPKARYADARARFEKQFGEGGRVRVIRSPGRVNLIGEHTDYNDGFVLPMATDLEVLLACRGRDDGVVRFASAAFPDQPVEFSIQQKIEPGRVPWANYIRGVAAALQSAGLPLVGMDALLMNTLPVGGGLSSSAAIEVATAQALLTLQGLTMDAARLAMICQKAEHDFAGVPCGIMDQTIVAGARAGHAMLLDCRDLSRKFVTVDPMELRVVVVNSMIHHELADGEYARRRKQCEQAVEHLRKARPEIRALRDVTAAMLDASKAGMDGVAYRRARHVVSENERTVEAAEKLSSRMYEEVGQLMLRSHASLRDDYEVSCAELDFIVDESAGFRGVYGARMTGGGFGGCAVALVQPRHADAFAAHIAERYAARYGRKPAVYLTTAAAAAGPAD